MKVIISGHVPPARAGEKSAWDETCWQKYALWVRQYRDVIIGSLYGHMNIDHFMLQDFEDINLNFLEERSAGAQSSRMDRSDRDTIGPLISEPNYLQSLRTMWSSLPSAPESLGHGKKKKRKSREDRFFKRIGGEWGERYSVTLVSPSVVPNYFPTLRVFEYNITSLEDTANGREASDLEGRRLEAKDNATPLESDNDYRASSSASKRKSKKKPKFEVPEGPSESSPPGPAYSPQSLSWIGYTQYFANLTYINNDFTEDMSLDASSTEETVGEQKWKHGKHHGKEPKRIRPDPRAFEYGVEYDTRMENDEFGLQQGLTVRNMIELASRIGGHGKSSRSSPDTGENKNKKKHKKKKKKHDKKRGKSKDRPWYAFVARALVSTVDPEDLYDDFE